MHKILTIEERVLLLKAHRNQKDGRTRDRMKAVLLYDQGWSYRSIAEALFLDEDTISKHVHEYQEDKKLSNQTSSGRASKLNATRTVELIAHLQEIVYLKVADICKYVEKQYGIRYTIAGMTSWLKEHKFTYKKPKAVPAKADPAKQEEWIKAYEHLVRTIAEEELILFCDGVHPTMQTKVTYGWIRKGTNKEIATIASRTRMNLMGALNLETMQVILEEFDTLDGKAMEQYFAVIRRTYPSAGKIHVILDQSGYNKSSDTQKAAEKYGIKLMYLPPYSPNLNPIERLWKVMNEYVRNNRHFKSAQEFKHAVRNFFAQQWDAISSSMIDRINDNFQRINPVFST